jgi:hypothetical protein
MSKESFQVHLPKDFFPLINVLDGTSIDAKVRVVLAIGLL